MYVLASLPSSIFASHVRSGFFTPVYFCKPCTFWLLYSRLFLQAMYVLASLPSSIFASHVRSGFFTLVYFCKPCTFWLLYSRLFLQAMYVLASLPPSIRLFQKCTPLYPKIFWPIEVFKRGLWESDSLRNTSFTWGGASLWRALHTTFTVSNSISCSIGIQKSSCISGSERALKQLFVAYYWPVNIMAGTVIFITHVVKIRLYSVPCIKVSQCTPR